MSKLKRPRWEAFCQNIVQDIDAKNSYIQAGYEARGNSAEAGASRLLRNDKIQARIEELRKEIQRQYDLTKERIFSILSDMLDTDLVEVTRTELSKLPQSVRSCIKKIKPIDDGARYEIELYSKHRTIEIVNKMMGYNEPDEVNVAFTFKDMVDKAQETDDDE